MHAFTNGRVNSHRAEGTLAQVMGEEMIKPANCLRIDQTGQCEEGFFLEINHPLTRGRPALVIGENRYLMRDVSGGRGCLYQQRGVQGFVRCAQIEYHEEFNIPLLRRLNGSKKYVVHVQFGLKDGVKVPVGLEPLWSGVGGCTLVMQSSDEAIVELAPNETLRVFYPTGEVVELSYGNYKTTKLDPTEALDERLERIDSVLCAIREDEDVAAKEDWILHELARMIRMTKLYPALRSQILGLAEKRLNGYGLRSGVYRAFRDALNFVGDYTFYGWMGSEGNVVTFARSAPARSPLGNKTPALSRAELEKRVKANREARHDAQTKKGPSGGGGQRHQSGGKGKKNKKK